MYNIDGFNERTNYIHNSNDMRKLNKNKIYDSSFAKMKIKENSPNIKTSEKEGSNYIELPKGDKDNFVIRNYNINHFNNSNKNCSNRVIDALNRNRFKNR